MQIDHDPRELSRKTIKIVAILTIVLTLAVMIPLGMGWRWVIEQMPKTLVALLFGAGMGFSGGFFVGAWDTKRQLRTPGKD